MPVLAPAPHTDVKKTSRSENKMEYDATYKIGQTTVHIVAPPPLSYEEREQILNEVYAAAWAILESKHEEKAKD